MSEPDPLGRTFARAQEYNKGYNAAALQKSVWHFLEVDEVAALGGEFKDSWLVVPGA
jgi:hypothetical protein